MIEQAQVTRLRRKTASGPVSYPRLRQCLYDARAQMRWRRRLRAALDPAHAEHERNLPPEALTNPDHAAPPRDAGPGNVVVVIPAHDEEELIGDALESIAAQTRPADEVIVVADRCGDRTVEIAIAHGATVIETTGNSHRKAGAINQALDDLLPRLSDNDAVLMMDADTSLSPYFLSEAALRLRQPEGDAARVGAAGGIFFGCFPVKGLIGHLQNNEYVRYAREIGRREGRADVLTGTGTLFSARALREVQRARSSNELPSDEGVYDVEALTEDNELTLALKRLGYKCVSPKACTVATRLPATISRLFYQRLRWQRGALENLRTYGLTRETFPYIGRQLLTYLGVAFVPFYLTVLIYTLVTDGSIAWPLFWIAVTAFVLFERTWSVRRGRWRAVGLSALVVPEVTYDLFLHSVYLKAAVDTATGAPETWAYTGPGQQSPWWRRARDRTAGLVYGAIAIAAVVGLAFACLAVGVAWLLIGGLVLAFAAHTALRLSGLDPLGFALGNGEIADLDTSSTSKPQGFGGRDVPAHAPSSADRGDWR
jgi:cellulose synthase/poly-beta-1,6-N-acetylglucosamine synthase-like glycosyltransferase